MDLASKNKGNNGNAKLNSLHDSGFFYSYLKIHFTQNTKLMIIYLIQETVNGLYLEDSPTIPH